MSNPDSEEHVSIHQYGSEEIQDVIDRRRPKQGSAAQEEFSLLHCIEVKLVMTEKCCKCLMRNTDSEHVLIHQ